MRRLHLLSLPAILTVATVAPADVPMPQVTLQPAVDDAPPPKVPPRVTVQSPQSPPAGAASAEAIEGLERPQPFRVRLVADHEGDAEGGSRPSGQRGKREGSARRGGSSVVGELTGQVVAWDPEGFDATVDRAPRRVRWDEVAAEDLHRLRKRLIEQLPEERRRGATEELAAYLLSRSDESGLGARLLESLRRTASDAALERVIRERAESLRAAREARLVQAASARLGVGSPEAAVFPTPAWPPRTPESQADLVTALRLATRERLAKAGRDATPVESTHTLVFSLISIEDAAKRATELDAFITASLVRLGLPREENPWHGRLVVIVSEDRDRFTLIEAAAFGSEARRDEIAIAHYDGPAAIVHLLEQTDVEGARPFVLRAVALALLHRQQSAVRLPAWANEGLADWLVAQHLATGRAQSRSAAPFEAALRREGLAAVRARGSFARTIGFEYKPGAWPFVTAADRGECYVLTSFLIERSPASFLRFVGIVKSGEPWRAAIQQAYGRTISDLLIEAWEFHRVND
jgi:hypothetical protein